jgi:microsomal epoxide hydrolase
MKAFQTKRAEYIHDFVRAMYRTPQSEAYLKKMTVAAMRVPADSAVLMLLNTYISGLDLRPALDKLDKPVLFVGTPNTKAQADMLQQRKPSARVEMFNNAGHALFVDEPNRFNELLADFASSGPLPK